MAAGSQERKGRSVVRPLFTAVAPRPPAEGDSARPAAVSPEFQSVRNCKIQEGGDGLLMNVETNQPFSYKDACVALGPHLGYDQAAAQAATEAVTAFLKSLFELK